MKRPLLALVRALLGLLLLAAAWTPLTLYFAWAAPALARSGLRGLAVLCLIGCVAWLAICWSAWRPAGGFKA